MTNPESTISGIRAAAKQPRDDADLSGATRLAAQLKGVVGQIKMMVGDARQVAGLAMVHATRMEQAKLRSLGRDHALLKLKLGDSHPRVEQLAKRLEFNRGLDLKLQSLGARVASAPPTPPNDASIVYGRVVSKDGQPVSGVKVTALGPSDRALGADVTDSRGRYELRVKAAKTALTTSKAKKKPAAAAELRLEVTGAGDARLHRGSESMAIDAGSASYREIVLDEIGSGERVPTRTKRTSRTRKAKSRPEQR
jgi:hypothetical protein